MTRGHACLGHGLRQHCGAVRYRDVREVSVLRQSEQVVGGQRRMRSEASQSAGSSLPDQE